MVTPSVYPAQNGGVANAVYWYAESLTYVGANVDVISSTLGLQTLDLNCDIWKRNNWARVIYIKIKRNNLIRWYLKTAFLLKSSKYDIIHFHSLLACFPFIILVPFIKSKIVWSVHGELDFHARKLGRTELKNIAFSVYKLFKAKFIFHSTCNQETQFIKDMMGRNTRIIQEQIVMRIPKRIECNKKDYVSFIGRIDQKKGIENLVRAFSNSMFIGSAETKLLIAGNFDLSHGRYLLNIVEQLQMSHRISFVGHLEGAEKEKFLAQSKFNFMPSLTENFGIATAEALAQGTPCVASKGTPWSSLEQMGAGYWISNSIESLTKTMNEICGFTADELKVMSTNARQLVEQEFCNKHNTSLFKTYDSILR